MITKTMSDLITAVQFEIGQVAGLNVQVYSKDNLAAKLQAAFLHFYDDPKVKWKVFETFATYVLDGTTGRTATDVSLTFKDYQDIYQVFPSTSDRPLVNWNKNINPSLITGTTPLQVMYDTVNIFRVLPLTATGSVTVVGKTRPTIPFLVTDTVPFDYLALVYFTAWTYLASDGANPADVEKYQQLFNNRYGELKSNQEREPVALNGLGSVQFPTTWRDA